MALPRRSERHLGGGRKDEQIPARRPGRHAVSLAARYAPKPFSKLMLGTWFVSSAQQTRCPGRACLCAGKRSASSTSVSAMPRHTLVCGTPNDHAGQSFRKSKTTSSSGGTTSYADPVLEKPRGPSSHLYAANLQESILGRHTRILGGYPAPAGDQPTFGERPIASRSRSPPRSAAPASRILDAAGSSPINKTVLVIKIIFAGGARRRASLRRTPFGKRAIARCCFSPFRADE